MLHMINIPIKNYSGVSVEFRQIKAAMGAPKEQMLPSFWSDNSTAIAGDFKHPIVVIFPQVWLPSSLENH